MKKLLAFILSFNLIVTPVVFAQDIDLGENSAYDAQSQIKKGGYDFYAKQILAASTSIIGANIISQCSFGLKVPSVATYMIGSLAYIASELLSAKAQNDHHKQKLSDLKKLTEGNKKLQGGQIQREILVQSKLDQQATLDYIKKKKLWTIAVTAIYATAMGLAISEEITGHASGVAAGTGSCTATSASLASACTVGYAGCLAGHMAACTALMSSGAVASEAAFASPTALATGTSVCAGTALYSAGCSSYLTSYMAMSYANCTPMPTNGILNTIMVKALVAAYSMGVTKGSESWVNYTSMLTQLFSLVVPGLEKLVMASYNFPIPRAVTFGVSTALSGLVSAGLIQRQNIVEKNVNDLDKMIADFKLKTDDPNGLGEDGNGNPSGLSNPYEVPQKNYEIKTLPNVAAPVKTCVSNQGNTFEVSPNACKTPIKVTRPKFNFNNGVKTLNDAGTLAADFTNALTGGDVDRANVIAGKLGNMASKINEVNKNLQAMYNEKQKAAKKPAMDFDKSINDKVASLQSDLSNKASSNGIDLASLGPAMNSEDINSPKVETNVIQVAAIPPADGTAPDLGLSDLDVSPTEESSDANQRVISLSGSLNDFESSESDIAKESDVSIFRQVSNRYLLNYTKIFNRKEIAPPMKEADHTPQ